MTTHRPLFVREKVIFALICLILYFLCLRMNCDGAVFNIPDGDIAALKSAITTANSNGQADVINLAVNGTYTLTVVDNIFNGPNGLPVIHDNSPALDLTINGNGAIIQRSDAAGTPEFRIFEVASGVGLTLNSLTIANGKLSNPTAPADRGAGIYASQASLTLTSCTLRLHSARRGGAIYNAVGGLTLNGCTLRENQAQYGGAVYNAQGTFNGSGLEFAVNLANESGNAPGYGGAIFNQGANNGSATVTLTGSVFTINHVIGTAFGAGGAIYSENAGGTASVALTNCTFDGNSAEKGTGGALASFGALRLTSCTLRNNFAQHGGAVNADGGLFEARGSTFEHNTAVQDAATASGGRGGAIRTGTDVLFTLADSALRENGADYEGGALFYLGVLSTSAITNCDFNANSSVSRGGAITTLSRLAIINSRVTGNFCQVFGGGIYTSGELTLERCVVSGNTAGGAGGIFNNGKLAVESCTFDNNKTTGSDGRGGAIGTAELASDAELVIRNSTLSNNRATRGGGVSVVGSLQLLNSTLSGNSATAEGGGLYNRNGTAAVENATFYGNNAPSSGGIYNLQTSGTAAVTLHNSVFKAGTTGVNLVNSGGTFTSKGSNLSSDPAGGDNSTGPGGFLNEGSDLRNSDPNLGPLQNNGGPTKTHLAVFLSPIIDSGDDSLLDPPYSLTTDQRGPGFPRRIGPGVDRGAVEVGRLVVVTTTDDHDDSACTADDCTLREAILGVNEFGTGTISFARGVTGTIELSGELPTVSSNLVLEGPGSRALTVRRNSGGDYRIFTISNGTIDGPSVSIKGLTMTNGRAPALMSPQDYGGGILNSHSTLFLSDCAVVGNSAPSATSIGGGICNYEGAIYIEQSTIAGNSAHSGGGIGSSLTIASGDVSLHNSTVSGNTASGGDGGGIYSGATNAGKRTQLLLLNCTLSGNHATASGFVGGNGGSIFNIAFDSAIAEVRLEDCTLAENHGSAAGGIYNRNHFSGATATVLLRNTILKNGATGGNFINSDGTISSFGHNICDDNAGGLSGTGPGGYLNGPNDKRETNPLLAPLQDNGGPTFTHALLSGSPAIGAAENNGNALDQRGYLRRGAHDVGAFESDAIELRVKSIARAGNDIVISFDATSGVEFRLQRKLALNEAWQNVPGVNNIVPTADGIAQFVDPGAGSLGRAFYQIDVLFE